VGAKDPSSSRDEWVGRYLTVTIETWPGLGEYELVRKHQAAAVVPVTPDDDILLVRQFRPPVRDSLLEIPAGLIDVDGEDALSCASRELLEETGFRAIEIEFLGGCYLSPGFTDEYAHLFWARTEPHPEHDPEEGIELVRLPFRDAVAAARAGRFRNVTTAIGILLAEPRLADAP
jgi:8-oxo-dGTP pyrophosphatase MutT (NUDIX family)